MILNHPLNKEVNKIAIEKYKDRQVKIEHTYFGLWFGEKDFVLKKDAKIFTFKEALKKTKHYKPETGIKYHFVDGFGEDKFLIQDFDDESIYNNPNITFDEKR